jgi:hypothetical protein
MREIKFRKWDAEEQVMIDGDSLAFEEYAPISHLLTQEGIMQYTGLKDKNGKEIYEGDAIKSEEFPNRIGQKYVIDNLAEFHYLAIDLAMGPNDIEVIGNIYENPELIEPVKAD